MAKCLPLKKGQLRRLPRVGPNYLIYRFQSPRMGLLNFRIYNNGPQPRESEIPEIAAGKPYHPNISGTFSREVIPVLAWKAAYANARRWFANGQDAK